MATQQNLPQDEPAAPESLTLAGDFPAPSRGQWQDLVAAVLRKSGAAGDDASGASEDALAYTTYDGITVHPLYTAEDAPTPEAAGLPGAPPFVRGARPVSGGARGAEPPAGWEVRTRHADPDAGRVNAAALHDLETGATSLWLVLGDGGTAVADLPSALEGVLLDAAPLVLDAGSASVEAATALLQLAGERGVAPAELRGSFGADPIGCRARTGTAADLAALSTIAGRPGDATGMRIATVDATVFHDAGASDAQELGIGTAVGVAYLRALVDGGLPLSEALAAVEFRWAVTAEQFPSIAKLRAARRVWDRVAELSGAPEDRSGQAQHAVTSPAELTRRDPWVNMLRATIGCFAAAVGGAEAITVTPFDAAIGRSDDFARRIARNTQSILSEESSLARVTDAAGGSWYVESLTEQLAAAAWDVFTGIERAGGALAALDDGTIGALLTETRRKRDDDIAHRRAPITGVSEFAFVDEQPVERPPADGRNAGGAGPLPPGRRAEPYEALRDRADAAAQRPTVFLAGLGPIAVHSARAGFAANLFQAGGLACVTGTGEPDDLVAAFRESGSSVACLCSSDAVYAEQAEPVARALREAGATRILLAGKGDYDGVDATIFTGCDALAVLRTTFDELGVPA